MLNLAQRERTGVSLMMDSLVLHLTAFGVANVEIDLQVWYLTHLDTPMLNHTIDVRLLSSGVFGLLVSKLTRLRLTSVGLSMWQIH